MALPSLHSELVCLHELQDILQKRSFQSLVCSTISKVSDEIILQAGRRESIVGVQASPGHARKQPDLHFSTSSLAAWRAVAFESGPQPMHALGDVFLSLLVATDEGMSHI